MNANVPGLGETEELQTGSPEAESPQPVVDSLPEVPAAEEVAAEVFSEVAAPAVPAETETPTAEAEAVPATEEVYTDGAAGSASEPAEGELYIDGAAEAEVTIVEAYTQDAAEAETAAVTMETATEGAVDAGSEPSGGEGDWLGQDTSDQQVLKRGVVLDGTVTSTSPTAVHVDVGAKSDGVIPGRELERMGRDTLEMLQVGANIPVFVVNPHDHNGDLILSLNRALEELDWRRAEECRESQEVYHSHVAGYNKGGLIVRFGRVRGFVPQSQLGPDRRRIMSGETPEERWGKMVNEAITVKVMEVDRARNRLILSERAAARESRETRKETLINRLQVGEVRTGKVVSLVDFGAFVDIGGAEGLVHLTELSWTHVTHPKELLKVGQDVKVEVISIDPDAKRIGLSMKRQEADPWDTVAVNYNVGQLVRGSVTKLTKFGAFVRLVDVPEIEGLVHISELSEQRVTHPREVLKEGDTVTLRVVKMDVENRRLGLSLKKVNSAEYLDMDWAGGE